jgi:hypothetical protein
MGERNGWGNGEDRGGVKMAGKGRERSQGREGVEMAGR